MRINTAFAKDESHKCSLCGESFKNTLSLDERLAACFGCLAKATRMLGALEGVAVPAAAQPGVRATQPVARPVAPGTVMSDGAVVVANAPQFDSDEAIYDVLSGKQHQPAASAKRTNGAQANGAPHPMVEQFVHSVRDMISNSEKPGLSGADVDQVLKEIGVSNRIDPRIFFPAARQFGIPDSLFMSQWNRILANRALEADQRRSEGESGVRNDD